MKKIVKFAEKVSEFMATSLTLIWVAAFILAVVFGTLGGAIWLGRWFFTMI